MKRFWSVAVGPILDILQPRVIVEIGSASGANTANLLQYCKRHEALLHVIDPAPSYDAEARQREYDENLVFHKGLSVDVLPEIEGYEAVLIDGDHNWYTVFNELKLIEEKCLENSLDFPLVLLHDIGWPYGRRDLYYDPATIPEEHRKPYEKKGLRWEVSGLVEEGGLNQHLYNAVEEGEPKEGVLTGIEDFLRETRYEIELQKLPGIHGLGILIPKQLRENNYHLANLLNEWDFPSSTENYVEELEKARMEQEIHYQKERREYRQRLADESQKLREQRQETRNAHGELRDAMQEVVRLTRRIEILNESGPVLMRLLLLRIASVVTKAYRNLRTDNTKATTDKDKSLH